MNFALKFKAFLVSKAFCVLKIKSLNFHLVCQKFISDKKQVALCRFFV